MRAVDRHDVQRVLGDEVLADSDESPDTLLVRGLAVPLQRQLHVLAALLLHKLALVEPKEDEDKRAGVE